MVFSSSLFLLYFLPFVLLVYFLTDKKYRNYVALAASIFFYAWGAPIFIFVVLGSIIADFYLVQWMYNSEGKLKRIYLVLSVVLNLGLLAYFKYANFFVDNLNVLLNHTGVGSISFAKIALPVGISFFTFQKFTYSIDVFRGKHPPLTKVTDLCLYILFFPQLIAGPIVRYGEIAEQLVNRDKHDTIDYKLTGFFRFIIGLSKKVLIANVLGAEADKIFALSGADLTTSLAWVGILAYAFQIYFDFSGYSDMAIGMAKMMGFVFPENFNNPYISQSITEFWKRWHMTLGRWMRDYLYIPLGGSKVSVKRMYFNLWLVFAVSGLWHGAAWNFVVWGIFHGVFLIMDRLFLLKIFDKIGKYPSIAITFLITLVGWVLFRAESMTQAVTYVKKMFSFDFRPTEIYFDTRFITILIIAAFFSFIRATKFGEKLENAVFWNNYTMKRYYTMTVLSALLLIICIGSITSMGFNPFIYFRF
ncbi:MAG: sugar acetyltransferase [Bacteroidetes bacterium RIFOXYA12_FULL_35_11]|nr:MAG: sugar acetyltransferase [Bacteroidetes bacterium GWF2_35_48]OFY73454.1 MAG: sugar acetyltransferase [Bacteroidetes bacterium RIFOXYA12_FULL_35_11]OFY95305.1 MAG: sugar acetyltransferase [Bacteroidetes bacterium RIFOXYC12_FULL_35_7]HBX52358.1 MBOAT family protein [Bacteroidales bacterium]